MTNDEDDTRAATESEQQAEDTILSLLKSATATEPLCVAALSRDAYLQRLRSFHVSTYFAKPESLSPIVCARFGYVRTAMRRKMQSSSSCFTLSAARMPPALACVVFLETT